jgi:N-acyl-D-amino-acid deacylase
MSTSAHPTLVFRGGTVVDGTGSPARPGDVVVADGVVKEVRPRGAGPVEEVEIDAGGLVVAPGFIDAHTHSDYTIIGEPAGAGKLLQGVTTEVTGNCGFSAFPLVADHRALQLEHFAGVGVAHDDLGGCDPDWETFEGYAACVDGAVPGINVAALAGHGTLRIAVLGNERRVATDEEIRRMQALLGAALTGGAVGLSTGLGHGPPATSDLRELVALGATVAAHDGTFAFHARSASPEGLSGLDEVVEVGRRSGVRVHYSHAAINDPARWGGAGDWLSRVDRHRADGVDVTFDVYPYDASGGSLAQFLPARILDGGREALSLEVADPESLAAVVGEIAPGWGGGGVRWMWDRVVIAAAPDPSLGGRSVAELAAADGIRPEEAMARICARHWNLAKVIMHYRTEADMSAFLGHDAAMVGSDGSVMDPVERPGSLPHPRSFGYAPKVLGRYVRELGVLELEDAVRKLSGAVADRFRLHRRGRVAPGAIADLVVFDPVRIADRATYDRPHLTPVGVEYVTVAGALAVRDGVATGVRAGRVLRSGA